MYTRFFGLGQIPFSIAPDPRYLFMSERHREALAHLLYGLNGGGGFVLLTGEIGAGKTTVCRLFLEQIPAHCNVAYIFNPKQTVIELLGSICDEFGITGVQRKDRHATEWILTAYDFDGKPTTKDFMRWQPEAGKPKSQKKSKPHPQSDIQMMDDELTVSATTAIKFKLPIVSVSTNRPGCSSPVAEKCPLARMMAEAKSARETSQKLH